ncbi:MAG: penicillin-binding protein [Anaerolineales bacterium]
MPTTTDILRRRRWRQVRAQHGTQRTLRLIATLAMSGVMSVVLLIVGVGAALGAAYAYFTRDLPSAEALRVALSPDNPGFFQTTRIYDRTEQKLLLEVIDPRGGDRQYVAYNALPPEIISATVALEDKTFFTNPGYDVLGMTRALISNIRGEPIQGGSSITQQLVKNTLISLEQRAERSLERKIREVLMAAEIRNTYSPQQVLEWYLNTNFYGNLAYGIDAAALVYFNKHAAQLTLAEAAMLAAIPQNPALNPADNFDEAKQRQAVVLDVMAREGFITAERAEGAKAQPLTIQPPVKRFDVQAPHFSVYVRQQAVEILTHAGYEGEDLVNRGGLTIVTSLDLDLQHQAECVAKTQVARLNGAPADTVIPAEGGAPCEAVALLPSNRDAAQNRNVTNAAVVVLHPQTGEILALVGSVDYWNTAIAGNFNIAVDGLRQPGSSFKPFTYLEAFRQGFSPASMVLDVRVQYPTATGEPYEPRNYDEKFHGPVSMRLALARSYNIPAVETMNRVGVDNVIRRAHLLGINTLETGNYGLALSLGGGEVTLLDMTYAYSVFANMGVMAGVEVPVDLRRPGFRQLNPVSILKIVDRNDETLYEHLPATQPILSQELAYLINDVLSDNVSRAPAFGSNSPLVIEGRTAAAKTGTTNDFRDNWTMGYAPQLAVGVWVGNADNSEMQGVSGLTGAAPVWHAVMAYATRNLPADSWPAPPGLVRAKVCVPSGLLPTELCPEMREDIFIRGSEPTAPDNMWQALTINRETGKRATACTAPELREERVFQVLPPEAAEWAQTARILQPPTEYDPIGAECLPSGNIAIQSPQPFAYLRGRIEITGTVKADNFAFFRLQYGRGLNPTQFFQIEGDRFDQTENGWLQFWNTDGLDGLYTLQLLVVKQDQSFETAAFPVTIDNTPPMLSLLAPLPNQTYAAQDEAIVIQPQVQDNLALARVEFFVDDVLTATVTAPPYSTRISLAGFPRGPHTLFVRAHDAAGNVTEGVPVSVTVQ